MQVEDGKAAAGATQYGFFAGGADESLEALDTLEGGLEVHRTLLASPHSHH